MIQSSILNDQITCSILPVSLRVDGKLPDYLVLLA